MFVPVLSSSILGRAQKKGLVIFELINLRKFGEGTHQTVDDKPYGGGAGMILKPDVLARALKSITGSKSGLSDTKSRVILMSASGTPYKEQKAGALSKLNHLIIVCGHYEGVDERFIKKYVDEEISVGDYILTGGEIPAMVIADSITRLIPGVLEKEEALQKESFEQEGLLEYPQYTRPQVFEGLKVPKILLSGDHQKIEQWQRSEALKKTKKVRPELISLKRIRLPLGNID